VSKAFTREDAETDDADLDDDAPAPVLSGRIYITPQGHAALKAEYDQLHSVERPAVVEVVSWAASNGDRSENGDYLYGKKRLREIDRRLRYLGKRMKEVTVVDPARQTDRARVYFGATVTVVDDQDRERTVTIVGQDEMDATHGRVSFVSPIARALMKAQVGDVVTLATPAGPQELEVLAIRYPAA
jgi:transcription elongation factor GreB